MPPAQRKDDILHAEIPSTLPLMALRSTIVYPLGTIAVQMGAPENLALLKANEHAGLIERDLRGLGGTRGGGVCAADEAERGKQ